MNPRPKRGKATDPASSSPPSRKKRPDGDRARRTPTDLVRDALERKRKTREWTIDDAPLDFPDLLG